MKDMATSGGLSVTECCVIPYHLPQGAPKFDLQIDFKIFSKFPAPHPHQGSLSSFYQFQLLPEGAELPHACKRRKCQQTHAPASATEAWTQEHGINVNCFIVTMRRMACIESSCQSWGH